MAAHYFPYIAGVVVLGVLVLFHEWGHFIIAKRCGVRVDVFSIGFGPRLWGVKRGDTDYRISALPLGGYVRMAGDNPVAERTGAAYEFLSRPRWQRFLIAIAGPVMNILLAFVIFWGIYALASEPYLPPVIEEVKAGTPAESAGLKPGDTIVSIGGVAVSTSAASVDAIRGSAGHELEFVVQRDGKELRLVITPASKKLPNDQSTWMIGASIASQEGRPREGIFAAAKDAGLQTVDASKQIAGVFAGLFSGRVSVHDLAGPVGIMQMSSQAAKIGPVTLLGLAAIISLNLGLLNLLPIPILDGGHVLMLVIEGVLGRDLSIAVKERFVQVGLIFLLGVFAFVMYSDILRAVQHHAH